MPVYTQTPVFTTVTKSATSGSTITFVNDVNSATNTWNIINGTLNNTTSGVKYAIDIILQSTNAVEGTVYVTAAGTTTYYAYATALSESDYYTQVRIVIE